jgi:HK97 family phage major capsid protein
MKKTFSEFLTSKSIEQTKFEAMTAEEKAGLYNDYNTELKSYIETLEKNVDDKASKEELEKAVSELNKTRLEQMETLNKALNEMGLAIKAGSEGAKSESVKGLREMLKDNQDRIKSLKNGKEGFDFEVKAVGTMLESTNVSGGNVPVEQRIAGLNIIPSRRVRLMDLVSRGTATSNIISWVYQSGKEGAAGGTLEGALKNQIDFNLVVASQNVVKRTAFIKVSTEMLDDIDFIETEINNELLRELNKDIELTAYEGDNTAPNMNGVYTTATAFAAGAFALAVDNANNVDVIEVALNQIDIAEQEPANAILMHPTDVTALRLIKLSATDKRYLFADGVASINGVPIIKTTLVTAGTYLVGAFNLATLYDKGSIRIEMGLDGDDFTKNLRTIIAEYRGAMVVKNNDRTAFVKGVFATDKAALETA